MLIRRMTVSDVDEHRTEICQLLKLCVESTYKIEGIEQLLLSKVESLLLHLDGGNAIVFGAFECESLCGFIWAYPYKATVEETLHVAYVAVFSQFRNRGIACQLLAEVEQQARKSGIRTMEIVVSSSNDAAVKTYVNAGFTVDRKVMVKSLNE